MENTKNQDLGCKSKRTQHMKDKRTGKINYKSQDKNVIKEPAKVI
jgi:hypothetical protein